MGTANPKTTIDTHRQIKSNPNTTIKMVIKPQERRGRKEKRPTETNPEQLKWQ